MNKKQQKLFNDQAKHYASEGNLSGIKQLIEQGFEITSHIDQLLSNATDGGHIEVIEYLAEHGANIAWLNIHDLHTCAINGHVECVMWLAERIKSDESAFSTTIAAFCGAENIDVVRRLVDMNTEADLSDITRSVPVFNDVELVKHVCERSSRFNFAGLYVSAGMGNLDVLRYLAETYQPLPTEKWETAIEISAKEGQVDTTLFIIDQGCNPDLALANGTDEVKAAVKTKLLYDELTAKLERSEETTTSIRKTKV